MAAGSVMNDPNKGTMNKISSIKTMRVWPGRRKAKPRTESLTRDMTGRLAATTMMTNTNMGSV